MRQYKYFVSYVCEKDRKTGFGNSIVERNNPIYSDEAILSIEKDIEEIEGFDKIILLNFKEMKNE